MVPTRLASRLGAVRAAVVTGALAALGAGLGSSVLLAGCGRTDLQVSEDSIGGSGGVRSGIDAAADGRGAATGGHGGTGGQRGTGGNTNSAGTGGRTGAVDGGVRDAVVVRDAAFESVGPDLPSSTPGTVACGTSACDSSRESCCVTVSVGAVARCLPLGSSCGGGVSLECDEPADCPGGTCCFGLQAGSLTNLALGSRCVSATMCTGLGRFTVCRTNNDCGGGTPACCLGLAGVPICQAVCR